MSQTCFSLRSTFLAGVFCCLLAPSGALAAGSPAGVTVRVEGLSETKIPSTAVTTTAAPVVKDGNASDSCPGTSALGALELASSGNWSGPWEAKFNQYSIYAIAGETHEFDEASTANYYWSFWLDNREATVGACEAELQAGDQVLFFPSCYGSTCPAPAPTPLAIEVPASANAGEAVTVTVKQYNSQGEASPAVGADVGGGGTGATTDGLGHATLKFFGDATYTLRASAGAERPPAIRAEATICVHEGSDGTCGTPSPPGAPIGSPGSSRVPPKLYTGPYALVARATSVLDGHVYPRHRAPRVLSGKAISKAAITSVSIRLRRTFKGRCWAYDGARERFKRVRCRRGRFFRVGSGGSSFSYLMPSKLPRGRYVLDFAASDAAGNHAPLDRGSSRIVFYVK
jgi:hypothetical protein